jgi:glutamate synthase domain-containing protein 1
MSNNSIHINNVETNEIVVREFTDEEQAERDAEVAAFQVEIQARKAKEQSDAAAKAALLTQLGITEEQAKLLLS